MKKLKELLPENKSSKTKVNEDIQDLDTNLPAQVDRFLERLINQIKGYNLPRKKETLVIAKIIDAMGMDKLDVMKSISKIKKAGVLSEETNDADIKPGFKFFEIYDGYTMSGRGTISDIWQVTKDLGDDKFECKLVSTSGMGSTGRKKNFTKTQILKLANPRGY